MIKKILKNRVAFTLVEMLIALSVFAAFVSILINSYSDVVRGQREANEYRIMYVEARRIFDTLTGEFRNGMVDYGAYSMPVIGEQSELKLVSKDGLVKTYMRYRNDVVEMKKDTDFEFTPLNSSQVKVRDFKLFISPSIDPYNADFVGSDISQFQPKITVYAVFERELLNGKTFSMDLQTTVSSRIYNQINAK
ncbi:prepilin-type N-terminal cleavage/methylation domain-containing protein [Candidatus Peregrinibacteria bacterium]|nr:prepilin-type N-terminal cleavage/methylation domain-containing protein [Candidatus Peregrinibacteria bacterium]